MWCIERDVKKKCEPEIIKDRKILYALHKKKIVSAWQRYFENK
jgi:hypothetical protein